MSVPAGTVIVNPPVLAVTVYEVIELPPSAAGGHQLTVALVFPATATTFVGAPGTVRGVTGFDGSDGGPLPTMFTATTVNVYVTPFVRPETVAPVAFAFPLAVCPPGEAVTVYPVIELPPFELGAVHVTLALAFPGAAATFVGAPGTVLGVTAFDCADGGPSPATFVATTTNRYVIPFVRPVTVAVVVAPSTVAACPPGAAVTE